jgi:hypothetical protein
MASENFNCPKNTMKIFESTKQQQCFFKQAYS